MFCLTCNEAHRLDHIIWKNLSWKRLLTLHFFSSSSADLRHSFSRNAGIPLLHVSETHFTISSTWLPISLRKALFATQTTVSSTGYIKFTGDHNAHMSVVEFEIGRIQGQISVDDLTTLSDMEANLSSRHDHDNARGHNSRRADNLCPGRATSVFQDRGTMYEGCVSDIPKIAAIISVQSFSFDLLGPKIPSRAAFGPGSANDVSHSEMNVWRRSDVLTLGCSALHLTTIGEYTELCLRQTEQHKRDAKKKARTNNVFVPISLRDVTISKNHQDSVIGDRRASDPARFSINQLPLHPMRCAVDSACENVTSDARSFTGHYTQAYPLPIPAGTVSPWKSRVEIFREEQTFDFIYSCTTTLTTRSVDVIFSGDRFRDDPHLPSSPRHLPLRNHPRASVSQQQHEILDLSSIEIMIDVAFAGWDHL